MRNGWRRGMTGQRAAQVFVVGGMSYNELCAAYTVSQVPTSLAARRTLCPCPPSPGHWRLHVRARIFSLTLCCAIATAGRAQGFNKQIFIGSTDFLNPDEFLSTLSNLHDATAVLRRGG